MKKSLTLLLTLLMVFTLVGCNSKEDTPVVQEPEKQEEVVEETKEEPEIVGGYIDVEDGTLTDELRDIFNKALEGLLGATYEPQELVATQVVAGTNYKFLANGTKTTNPITKGTYYITIYKDLQGNVELLDIETIEEKQEETKEADYSQVKFWVVFYDQYDNELQREALMYGSTPRYKGYLPDGFVKWTYKKTGKDVNTFVSITTNTYFKAVCNYVSAPVNPEPTPVPDPEYEQIECLTSPSYGPNTYIISGLHASDNMKFEFKAQLTAAYSSAVFGYWKAAGNGLSFASYSKGEYLSKGLDMYFGNVEGIYESGSVFGAEHTYEYQLKQDDTYVKMDGNEIYRRPTPYSISVDEEMNISIFTTMYTGDVPMNSQPLSLYYLKIYQDGSLVRDYIPVKTLKEIDKTKNAANDSTVNIPVDTLCLYDKLNDKYYLNVGSVAFTDTPIY